MDAARVGTMRIGPFRTTSLLLLVLLPFAAACGGHQAGRTAGDHVRPSGPTSSELTAPPQLGRCRKIVFEGRRYVVGHRPPGAGAGVGAELGTGTAYHCGGAGSWTVKVYSVNEQPKEEAITVSDEQHVWVYDAVG